MRRIALALLVCGLAAVSGYAQTTTVTGTVLDPNALAYYPATIKAQLTTPGATVTINNQAQCVSAGAGSAPCQVPIQGTFGPTPLSTTGTFTMVLYDNTQIQPAATQWIFTVSTNGEPPPVGTGPQTFSVTQTISGASQDISTVLQAAAPVLSMGIGGSPTFGSVSIKGPAPWRDFTAYMPKGGCARTANTFPVDATGTITSGSKTLTLSSAADFKNGCGVAVLGAGPTSVVPIPVSTVGVSTATSSSNVVTITTSTPHGLWIGSIAGQGEGVVISGCLNAAYNGTFPLTTVVSTTVFTYTTTGSGTGSTTGCAANFLFGYAHGITGSTVYNYQLVAIDANMGFSAASSTLTISNGNATLSPNNYNWLGWAYQSDGTSTPNKGAIAYAIYSDKGLGGAKTCVGVAFNTGYADFGLSMPCPVFLPTNPPVAAGAQALNTTIAAGAGSTTVTLAAAASTSVTANNVYHDDSTFLNSCVSDVITDQLRLSNFYQGAWGCYIPPSPGGPWEFNGPMPTQTITTNLGTKVVQIQVAGGIRLSTMPWMVMQRNFSILGIGGGGTQTTFGHEQETPVQVDASVPAAFVVDANAFSTTVSGFGIEFVNGYGIWVGQGGAAFGGPASINLSHDEIIGTPSTTTGGFPVVFDANVLGVWMDHDNLIGNQNGTAPVIYFTGTNYSSEPITSVYITNLTSAYHGFKFDLPGGGVGPGTTGPGDNKIFVNGWLSESVGAFGNPPDVSLFVHDNGPNAPGASTGIPLLGLFLNNVNNADSTVSIVMGETGSSPGVQMYGAAAVGNAPGSLIACIAGTYASVNRACASGPNVFPNGSFTGGGAGTGANPGSFGGGFAQVANTVGGSANSFFLSESLHLTPYFGTAGTYVPILGQTLVPPSGYSSTPAGGGSLAAGTYCWTAAAVDVQAFESDTIQPICSTVGASGLITALWDGSTVFQSQASGFTFYFCFTAGTVCTPNQKITGLAANGFLGAHQVSFTFSSTAGAVGGSPNVNPKAMVSWLNATRGSSCLFCVGALSDQWPIGIGALPPAPGSGFNLSTALGMKVGTQLQTGTITTATNCAVNSASPAACGSAAAGAFVIPTTTITYTVNTTAVTAASRIFLFPMSFAGNLPSSPTCVVPAITAEPTVSAIVAGTSFTMTEASTTGQTCWQYLIVN